MPIDLEDEVLQDFLVEAGEILEELGNQLVDLEQRGDDKDLLNTVFRGFHTIKGGAGFLALDPLVALCHIAEDVFNLLRNGEKAVDAHLMDVILPVLDSLNDMFDSIRAGEDPADADPQQLENLRGLLNTDSAAPAASVVTSEPAADDNDITDDEFEAMLDAAAGNKPAPAAASETSDEISDDEFESLLDELHGSGKIDTTQASASTEKPSAPASTESASDEITDDEFDDLLDQLHGATGAPGANDKKQVAEPVKAEEKAPAEPEKEKKAEKPAAKKVEKKEEASKPPKTSDKAAAKEPAAATETTVRVDTKRLDDIMNLVGELVLVRNRLSTLEGSVENENMSAAVSNLDVVTADLQNAVMKTRMQPIKKVFGRFPRVVRDLARSLGKEITLEMEGEDTDLDKNLVEALADPLVHLVRNSVDHGIEMPDVREQTGKIRNGRVLLKASQEGDHIELTITDDGKGMDANVLRGIAVDKGMMDEESAARLSDNDCYNLIFAPGFSTKKEISDISGRGVGMDVVKTRIVQLNGSVEIDSTLGNGSVVLIKVPLTLAIMPTLMVVLGSQTFALPLVNVCEIFDLDLDKTNIVDGQQVVIVRDKPVPLYYLSEWLANNFDRDSLNGRGHVVIVSIGTQRVGFVVDELIGQEEVVIKPLGAMLQGMDGMAGATITGDGNIALILDVPGLLKKYARRF